MKICLLKKLVPSTLRPRNRDPRAHHASYTEEESQRWRRAQKMAGLNMVEEAKERETRRLADLQLRLRGADREQQLNDEAWLICQRKIQHVKASKMKTTRREHGVSNLGTCYWRMGGASLNG